MTEQCLYLGKTGAVQTGQEASEEVTSEAQ